MGSESARQERQDDVAEEDGELRSQQFVMDESAPGNRRRKQERNLSLGKDERAALMRYDPGQEHDQEQEQRSNQFEQWQRLR